MCKARPKDPIWLRIHPGAILLAVNLLFQTVRSTRQTFTRLTKTIMQTRPTTTAEDHCPVSPREDLRQNPTSTTTDRSRYLAFGSLTANGQWTLAYLQSFRQYSRWIWMVARVEKVAPVRAVRLIQRATRTELDWKQVVIWRGFKAAHQAANRALTVEDMSTFSQVCSRFSTS